MKYSDRKKLVEDLNPEQLNGGKTAQNLAEGYYRWYMIQLLADIADNVGSMAYAYQEMLKIQQLKSGIPVMTRPAQKPYDGKPLVRGSSEAHRAEGIPPTEQSRYGGPK